MNFERYGVNAAEILSLLGAGAVIGGVAVRSYMKSLLNDEGHRVYVTPDFEALQAIIGVCETNGLEPAREIKDEMVYQVLMGDNRTVFLVTRPDVWEDMGRPTAAPMLRVKDPLNAAMEAQKALQEKGFSSEVISPMADQTEGEIFFVRTDALSCGLIGFREHVVKMGPKPPKWSPQRTPEFKGQEA